MSTVTHKAQPAIHKTGGSVDYCGNKAPYTISTLLWSEDLERWLSSRFVGSVLHVCCGLSKLGDVRLDMFQGQVDIRADAARLPFVSASFDTVLIDPPYNGVFQWNHDMLSELARIAGQRIIFQHWFLPIDRMGRFKKCHKFYLAEAAAWQPRTYFGRANIIAVMDRRQLELI